MELLYKRKHFCKMKITINLLDMNQNPVYPYVRLYLFIYICSLPILTYKVFSLSNLTFSSLLFLISSFNFLSLALSFLVPTSSITFSSSLLGYASFLYFVISSYNYWIFGLLCKLILFFLF